MVKSLLVRAHAKINFYLNVTGKRPDGYHDIETVFHSIGLHDDVTLRRLSKPEILIQCNHPSVPCDAQNLGYRAAQLLMIHTDSRYGVDISIKKRIPPAGGLAGGSANAAAVLRGMNELFEFGLSQPELMCLGLQLGADVPFCLLGGAAIGRGVGEILTPLPALKETHLLLTNQGIEVRTGWAFQHLHFALTNRPLDDIIVRGFLEHGDRRGLAENMYNCLEIPVFLKFPDIEALKCELASCHGSYGALMSGSGATVFSVMQDAASADQVSAGLSERFAFCTTTTTSSVGLSLA
ncbi:MAG: 4-(cytidine 5'-diphospho)-2-C-methyl-D-erythritol kinase [Candidatus Poribacteria bacterium]|nr:4-(cytidine 5'-diphospho)-2-C-methyl-D-erythritol kinase [Candidatus Poribacteria bacterium]MDE0505830.1 4-(cytidine 5'-diphospho)-2-C-methyl-D-erythritol kinase [Candidatus Poribacteria bacterium]